MSGVFAEWQPQYAARGIVTVPVDADRKAPAVKGPDRFGMRASSELVHQFSEATALGFIAGRRNNITALDIDTDAERVLADALNRHGHSPFIVRTASGKFHAYYRHNGERRKIRPWQELPVDLLGGGLCIAAPSIVTKGQYQIVEGTLDDPDRLPIMRGLEAELYLSNSGPRPKMRQMREGDGRNNWLFRQLGSEAHSYDDLNRLLDRAQTLNKELVDPMQEAEVAKIVGSIWKYTAEGRNRFGKHGAWFSLDEVERFNGESDEFFLLGFLRAHNQPEATFMVANGLAERLGWTLRRLVLARSHLIARGYLKIVRQARQHIAALYRWRA